VYDVCICTRAECVCIAFRCYHDLRVALLSTQENVYLLAQKLSSAGIERGWVVFISNLHRQVPCWRQQACVDADRPVIWDYHVIYIAEEEEGPSTAKRVGYPIHVS
jgi:hypothetical protein